MTRAELVVADLNPGESDAWLLVVAIAAPAATLAGPTILTREQLSAGPLAPRF